MTLKQTGLLILMCCCTRLKAQEKTIPFDGPYVRFDAGRIIVTRIVKDDDLLLPKTERFTNKHSVSLVVMPEAHPDWAFTVKLRDTLINDPATYSQTGKTLYLSDIEGEFANFRRMLIEARVIDEQYQWTFGNNTLVIPGDLFDRGRDVVPELWLLYKLEGEARDAGGLCLVLAGNHDVMALSGDHRYTEGKYFKDAWLMKTDIDGLFGSDTELGRWLRTKNVIAKVGNVLVMHGGLSPELVRQQLTLEQINAKYRPYDQQKKNDRNSPFWYRGYFMAPKASPALVDSTLDQYGCKYIVIGHTIVKWNIASYYGGKVIGVDVDEHQREPEAALYDNGRWLTIDATGQTKPLIYQPSNDHIKETDIL